MDAAALKKHSRFFDHLVDLVPAKYYLDSGEEKVNLKYLKKSARDEARAAFKQQAKAAKRAKLDPEQAKGTLALQKEAAAKAANGAASSDDSDDSGSDGEAGSSDDEGQRQGGGAAAQPGAQQPGGVGQLAIGKGKPPSREELRERLQKKLEGLRKARKAEEQQKAAADAKQWRERNLQEGRKKVGKAAQQQQQQQRGGKGGKSGDAALPVGQQQQQQGQQQGQQHKGGKRQRDDDGTSLAFNKLDFGSDPRQRKKQRRKASKQQLLAEAEAKTAAAAGLAASAEGKAALEKEAWGAALQRAKGEKVLDDPRLLRKSIKKEAKIKAKKSQAWQERLKQQTEQQQAKQQKRKDNIDSRIKARQDKKKARREKKLLRAGFEGRKQGFIDTPKRS